MHPVALGQVHWRVLIQLAALLCTTTSTPAQHLIPRMGLRPCLAAVRTHCPPPHHSQEISPFLDDWCRDMTVTMQLLRKRLVVTVIIFPLMIGA